MAQKNFLKTHIDTLIAELGKIQDTICGTDKIPAKELIVLQKKYLEIQEALKFVGWLNETINNPDGVKENQPKGNNGKQDKGRIITI